MWLVKLAFLQTKQRNYGNLQNNSKLRMVPTFIEAHILHITQCMVNTPHMGLALT